MIDDLEKQIIGLLQKDIPIDPKPYKVMADILGIDETELMKRVEKMIESGVIRRFGATLYHQEAGFSANAMVAWVIPEDIIDETGDRMAEFREVTHCYQRRPQKDWKYNLYTMVHGDTRKECYEIVKKMSEKTGMKEYSLLFSEKEFKKTSMEYF